MLGFATFHNNHLICFFSKDLVHVLLVAIFLIELIHVIEFFFHPFDCYLFYLG
jgi:hypothetical protein